MSCSKDYQHTAVRVESGLLGWYEEHRQCFRDLRPSVKSFVMLCPCINNLQKQPMPQRHGMEHLVLMLHAGPQRLRNCSARPQILHSLLRGSARCSCQ